MSYELHWESKGVVKRYFGRVSGGEIIQSLYDVHRDERFDDLRFVINDFLGATDFSYTADEVERIAILDMGAYHTNPNILVAVVATLPAIVDAAALYVDSPVKAFTTRIFSDLETARAWAAASISTPRLLPATMSGA